MSASQAISAYLPSILSVQASPENSGETAPSQTLGKRDAQAFVRAVKRFGRKSRLGDIAATTGLVLEEASEGARKALWHALVRGCETAIQGASDAKVACHFMLT